MNTAVFFTPKYLDHDPGPDHPDSPDRLKVIMNEIESAGLLKRGRCEIVEPKAARLSDLELVHEPGYVELVKRSCKSGVGLLDLGDTVVGPTSYRVALLAVGGVVDAVNWIASKKTKNAFALVRPPGHHAGPYYALGFCLFNNVAIGAMHLLRRLNRNRVLILDIDAHHGNGTQEIFYNTDKVLYVGMHHDPKDFPGTGFMDEVGETEGLGFTVNIPFPPKVDSELYLQAFDRIVDPIVHQFKPQFILISAGFDGHYTDPIGGLSLSMQCYGSLFSKIMDLAHQLCDDHLIVALEGGYSLTFLGKMVTSAVAKMSGGSYSFHDACPVAHPKTRKRTERVINAVRRIQSSFWEL